jgi:hypothetical protein
MRRLYTCFQTLQKATSTLRRIVISWLELAAGLSNIKDSTHEMNSIYSKDFNIESVLSVSEIIVLKYFAALYWRLLFQGSSSLRFSLAYCTVITEKAANDYTRTFWWIFFCHIRSQLELYVEENHSLTLGSTELILYTVYWEKMFVPQIRKYEKRPQCLQLIKYGHVSMKFLQISLLPK